MRRPLALLLLSLSCALALAACGGGGDDDDATPTSAATATRAATATTAAVTATEGSGAGSGAGSGGAGAGGTTVPVDATQAGGAAATATRRPATVVSTPRPIATRPPEPTAAPDEPTATDVPPTEAGATSEPGNLTIVMEEFFEAGSSDWFDVGTTEFGTTLEIVDGQYVITPAAENWQTLTVSPDDSWFFADGLITADVTVPAGAQFGLVSRQMQDDAGAFHFYVCYLTGEGVAGCSIYNNDTFTTLFSLPDPIEVLELNTLTMQMIGVELIFEVNGIQVGAIDDSSIEAGYWGFYVYGDATLPSTRVEYAAIAVP